MLIIPAIDLKDGHCVRLSQGRKEEVKTYDDNPLDVASRFEASGAQMLHVVDLDGAFKGGASPNRRIAREITAAVKVPVQFGGGLRRIEDVQELIDSGVARVVIGTLAVESPDTLAKLAGLFGAQICVGIDARDGEVVVRGWEKKGTVSALDLARRVADAGVERIVYTDVERDGMLGGLNIEATRILARGSGLKVTASGGVSSLDDLKRLRDANEPLIDSVIVGKALYEMRFSLEEALRI
jgi:phosphoribosylformimino-5-aminoimidazole carboxamide ribotide isomerase